jgi:heme oxygenase (biliverdin-IX-beta and delta-forming)
MTLPPHDAVQRLNQHHADDVLAVARVFGGHPEAAAAQVIAIDPSGLDLLIETPDGEAKTHVAFVAPAASLRLAFRELARQARVAVAR